MFVNRSDEVNCYETESSRTNSQNIAVSSGSISALNSRVENWFSRMDSEINILDDNNSLATPFSVKNILNLNSTEHTIAGHSLGTQNPTYALDSLVSVCSSTSQNAAAAAAAMSGYPTGVSVSSASYHHMDATGLMMGHPPPHLHHNSHHPGGGGGGVLSTLHTGLDVSTPTSSSCEYGGSGTLLPPHHPGLSRTGGLTVAAAPAPPAAAPVPPSYSSLPDLTQATLRLGSEFGLQDSTPPPPVTSPSSISSLASTSVNLCPANRDSNINVEKSEYLFCIYFLLFFNFFCKKF